MWNNLRWRLKFYKPGKLLLIKMITMLICLSLLFLTTSLGIADPGSGPPPPK